MNFPMTSSSAPTVPVLPSQSQSHNVGGNLSSPEISKIRDLAEQIRQRCTLHLTGQSQSVFQVSHAEEMTKRLKEITEKLQAAVKDFSLEDLKVKLEKVASTLGLKFETRQLTQTHTCSFFIISEAFYCEVCCQGNGHVTTTRLVQASQQMDSDVLCRLLHNHDYAQFENHLGALRDFYKPASTQNEVSNMYRTLVAIEKEIMNICDKSPQMAVSEMIMSNPFGHVTPRKGGLPQYLTIFIHPSEVLRNPFLSKDSPRQEVSLDLGVAVKIMMEKSYQMNRLSTIPNLFDFTSAHFRELTDKNSILLPMNFTLELSKPLPTCGTVLDKLHEIVFKTISSEQRMATTSQHINQLVAQTRAVQEGRDTFTEKSRIVCLPSQRQYYLMPAELRSGDGTTYPASMCGAVLSKVVYSHPVHLFSIIPLLRKQLMYNTLLDSCLGKSPKGIPPTIKGSEFIFEVTTMPPDKIVVAMDTESTNSDSQIIFEFIIPDQAPRKLHVVVKVGNNGTSIEQPQLAEVTGRCLSIPVALHVALKHPVQLLGAHTAAALQTYQSILEEFNRELGSLCESTIGGVVRGLREEHGSQVSYLGLKRKRVD